MSRLERDTVYVRVWKNFEPDFGRVGCTILFGKFL